jgi:Predicted N-formylglutamate amidohydrolase
LGNYPGTLWIVMLCNMTACMFVEVRNDLIETPSQQLNWATRLAPIFTAALADISTQELPHG